MEKCIHRQSEKRGGGEGGKEGGREGGREGARGDNTCALTVC